MSKKIILLIIFSASLMYNQVLWAAARSDSFKVRAAALMGYDNNTGLNANRQEDAFAQESVSLAYQERLNYFSRFRFSGDILNVNYFKATDENVLLPSAGVGFDLLLLPQTVLETDYNFTYVYFPNDISVTSSDHDGRVGLKQVITKNLTWRGGFTVSTKDFEDRKLRKADGNLSISEERGDLKYIADTDLSIYLSKTMLLKLGFNYYWNDSNYVFNDYYDYEGFKLLAGLSANATDRISWFTKFAYENRDYDSRPLTDQSSVFENDDIYTASGGIFYSFDKNLSLGSVYSYRQKNSNEPSQKYSGSISTLGFYYSF